MFLFCNVTCSTCFEVKLRNSVTFILLSVYILGQVKLVYYIFMNVHLWSFYECTILVSKHSELFDPSSAKALIVMNPGRFEIKRLFRWACVVVCVGFMWGHVCKVCVCVCVGH